MTRTTHEDMALRETIADLILLPRDDVLKTQGFIAACIAQNSSERKTSERTRVAMPQRRLGHKAIG